jgi:chromosome partitioning protein
MILLIGGQKGGCGKTTLSTNIAGYLATQGKDVLLIDGNKEQANATNWAAKRDEIEGLPSVTCVEKSGNLAKAISDLAGKYEHIVVDTGGQDSKEFRTALFAADMVLSPFECSQYSLDTVPNVIALIEMAREANPDLIAKAVISKAPTAARTTVIDETRELLSSIEEFDLLDTVIYIRQEYIYTAGGTCVEESKNMKAKNEIRELVKELY